jgi:CheY-like chemotaxis protein
MRVITVRLLESYGYQVRTAHDGPSALEIALEYRPDVVLLDIGLPEMDGYEVAKRMRQDPALQKAVLVAVTGYGLESDRLRSQEAGFDHHLVKPVDFDKLLGLLATIAEARATDPQ